MPALHYRWHYDREFAEMEFGRNNDPELFPVEQRRIGEKIARQFAGWLGPLGITSATIPAIEAEYLGLLADLEQHFAQHDFLFGAAPSLVDCALFGPLQAHLFRDPNSGRVMRRHAPQAIAWLVRMHTPVLARARWDRHTPSHDARHPATAESRLGAHPLCVNSRLSSLVGGVS